MLLLFYFCPKGLFILTLCFILVLMGVLKTVVFLTVGEADLVGGSSSFRTKGAL
jgi:hypothetical protein